MSHRLAVVAVFFQVASLSVLAAKPEAGPKTDAQPTDVFAAIQAGDIEVGIVPQNERRLTLNLKNKTERPLTIMLPPALAAAPVLAQQPGGFFPGGLNQGGQNGQRNSPQQVGIGMNGGNLGGQNMMPGGIFNVPAGRAIKIKADTVCLEYGKPNPDARMKYELKPLAEVCDKPELVAVLTSLGKDQLNQRAAQAAAWHLTNDLSWEELAKLIERKVGATVEMQFKAQDIATAKTFLDKQKSDGSATPSQGSLSQSPKVETKTATAWASGGFRSFGFDNNGRGGGGVTGGGQSGGTGGGVGGFGGGGFGGGAGGFGGLPAMPALPGGFGGGAGGNGGGFGGGGGGAGGVGGFGGGAGGSGGFGGGGFSGGSGGGSSNGQSSPR